MEKLKIVYYHSAKHVKKEYRKNRCIENRDLEHESHKKYYNENRAKTNPYEKKRRETDFNFKLAHNIRVTTHQAFKSQKIKKT